MLLPVLYSYFDKYDHRIYCELEKRKKWQAQSKEGNKCHNHENNRVWFEKILIGLNLRSNFIRTLLVHYICTVLNFSVKN